jgi:hypothetical protein
MFRSGQPIIITHSNLSEKLHPNVGDQGFIGNAFLLPSHGFVVMEVYFYLYANNDHDRCERKMVVVNLDPESNFNTYFSTGSKRSLMRCLRDDMYGINLCVPIPDTFDNSGTNNFRNAFYPWLDRRLLDNVEDKIVMPVVKFKPLVLQEAITKSTGTLCSWINSMHPLILGAKYNDATSPMINRLDRLIGLQKSTRSDSIVYATPKHPHKRYNPWFTNPNIVNEIILILRKVGALSRRNKRDTFSKWLQDHHVDKETRRVIYQYYTSDGSIIARDSD